jgi:tyrosyl-tRNA synthetase
MDSKDGMSLAEFCYPVLQAWDWWHMYQSIGVQVQIGGADQFGNIITGIEGVKYVAKSHPHHDVRVPEEEQNWEPMGFTTPLMTTSSGEKFGKSAGNAIWLNGEMTSPFDLYAYMLSTSDEDIERYLKLFTFLPLEEISQVVSEHASNPEKRIAQHLLASEFLTLAHGSVIAKQTAEEHTTRASERRVINIREHLEKAKTESTERLRQGEHPPAENPELNSKAKPATANNSSTQTVTLSKEFLAQETFSTVLQAVGLVGSRSEGHRLITSQGAYVGGNISQEPGTFADNLEWRRITNTTKGAALNYVVWHGDKGLLVLRVGKWKVKIVRVYSEDTPILTDAGTDMAASEAPEENQRVSHTIIPTL